MASKPFLIKRSLQDKRGKTVLFQTPNLPLIVWLVTKITSNLVSPGTIQTTLQLISFMSLTLWALLELFMGSNYIRRFLGLIVLAVTIKSKL